MQMTRPVLWLLGAAAVTSLAACKPPMVKSAEPAPALAPALPPISVPPPTIDRAELLKDVAMAAETFALGRPSPKTVLELTGRRFSIKLPFGCLGPGNAGPLTYSYDDANMALRVSAQPERWVAADPVWASLASEGAETIEGFWIERPWIGVDGCPLAGAALPAEAASPALPGPQKPAVIPPGASTTPTSSSGQTVGLAQVFEKDGSRLMQRSGRAYQVIRKSEKPGAGGFRLVLEGRIVTPSETSPIVCRSAGANQRPVCLVRVEFDRVAIESASGNLLGEWNS